LVTKKEKEARLVFDGRMIGPPFGHARPDVR